MAIAAAPLRDLVRTIFEQAGSNAAEAQAVADHLIEANLMGHDSHGVIRVAPYIELLQSGKWTANRHAEIVQDAGAIVVVDGGQGIGQVIAKEAIELGIERARAHGVAVVGVRHSAHMGRIGAWAEQAAAAGLLSLHFVNTTGFGIQVAPFGGSDRRLSVNPIALGVPRPSKEPLIHDMSTGTIAAGKIRVARNQGELLPAGAIIDHRGRPTRDPEAFFTDPPGALTTAAGHKGYGLALFVEVLAGALTGGGSGHPDNPTADRPINNLLSILIDPERMAGSQALAADLERLTAYVTASPPATPGGEVLLPGEIERRTRAERLAHGIPLDPNTLDQLRRAARSVGLPDAEIECAITPAETTRES
jgi:hydroxycarboxylate dehydrogenase B